MSLRTVTGATVLALVVGGPFLLAPPSAGAGSTPTSVTSSSVTPTGTSKVHKVRTTEVKGDTDGDQPGAGELRLDADEAAESGKAVMNRSPKSRAKASRGTAAPSGITPTQTLGVTQGRSGFRGLDHVDQRGADGGNQYSLVPPDQALCTNGTEVFEGVNNAFRTYGTGGQPLTDTISANQFYFGDHEINRATGEASPHQVGDPSCVYDAGSGRFFVTVYDLAGNAAGDLLGPSSIEIAVSPPGTTIGTWSIYTLDTTDDGNNGTPSHPGCPCFGDYPHLGTDANGLYITTNEYSTLGDGYNGAQVYAIDKNALAGGTADLPAAHFSTSRQDPYQGTTYDGFTLAPAVSAGTAYALNTMYFLSSDAYAGDNPITSRQVLLWKIAGTNAISSNPGGLRLTHTAVATNPYTPPPMSEQKAGSTPLADCLNTTACAKVLLGTPNRYKEYEYSLDSSDSRMLQAAYANGKVWGALDTAVDVGNPVQTKAGVAYFVVNPGTSTTASSIAKQGTLAVSGENITFPSLGVTAQGRAAMALTLVGKDYYPSAAHVTLDDVARTPVSSVQVTGAGLGPYDAFDGYRAYEYNRPRWGDYGAASVVGGKVWLASEYIAQTCTLAQYQAPQFGTCGGTRTALANWATHVAVVTP